MSLDDNANTLSDDNMLCITIFSQSWKNEKTHNSLIKMTLLCSSSTVMLDTVFI